MPPLTALCCDHVKQPKTSSGTAISCFMMFTLITKSHEGQKWYLCTLQNSNMSYQHNRVGHVSLLQQSDSPSLHRVMRSPTAKALKQASRRQRKSMDMLFANPGTSCKPQNGQLPLTVLQTSAESYRCCCTAVSCSRCNPHVQQSICQQHGHC